MLTITNFQKVNKKGFTILKYLLKILAFLKKKATTKTTLLQQPETMYNYLYFHIVGFFQNIRI